MKKEDFFKTYENCASQQSLEKIWYAFEREATVLYLISAQIHDLSPVSILHSLQWLNCSNTKVADLTPLTSLHKLQWLNCSNTNVTDITPLTSLSNLRWLDCAITDVDNLSVLSNLQNLQTLICSGTKVFDLTPLSTIKSLQMLNCARTPVSDLTPLSTLKCLQELDCSGTRVNSLDAISALQSLKWLNCSKTGLRNLDPLSSLQNLQQIDFSYTLVENLSPLKSHFEDKELNVSFYDCPINNPPLIVARQGIAVILRYWKEQQRSGLQKINEARLLIVGQGGAGKTTLKEKIINPSAPMPGAESTTRGIDIDAYNFKNSLNEDFTLQLWDFGGQNIQHYAHQFFMSDSVVYALLSNEREQNPNFQYWLNIIELLGKDSPIVIIRNEKDGHCEPLRNAAQIQERFQNICNIESIDLCKAESDPRFDAIRRLLFSKAQCLPHVTKQYPGSFKKIRVKLQLLAKRQSSISYQEFKILCETEGIENQELIADYARTFTILGIALHFADDQHLKRTIFLRPKWIIEALFQLLYHKKVETQRGRFAENDAEEIWVQSEYEDYHGVLLRLMERFELCYRIEGTLDYIVPQRLPERMELFEQTGVTQVLYKYKFMPKGMLTRLTCRLNQRIDGEQAWSDAVQFFDKNSDAKVFVREVYNEHCIELNAFGGRRENLLNQIIDTLDDIHTSSQLVNLQVDKLVPCPCEVCESARLRGEKAHFFYYQLLINLIHDGESQERCHKSRKMIRIQDIMRYSGVRAFNSELINDLISEDRVVEATDLLLAAYDKNNDIFILAGQLTNLSREQYLGKMDHAEYRKEKARITDAILSFMRYEGAKQRLV